MATILVDDIFKCIFFTEICSQESSIVQVITLTNADLVHWCIYAALVGDELINYRLTFINFSMSNHHFRMPS